MCARGLATFVLARVPGCHPCATRCRGLVHAQDRCQGLVRAELATPPWQSCRIQRP